MQSDSNLIRKFRFKVSKNIFNKIIEIINEILTQFVIIIIIWIWYSSSYVHFLNEIYTFSTKLVEKNAFFRRNVKIILNQADISRFKQSIRAQYFRKNSAKYSADEIVCGFAKLSMTNDIRMVFVFETTAPITIKY